MSRRKGQRNHAQALAFAAMEALIDPEGFRLAVFCGVPPELVRHCPTPRAAGRVVVRAGLFRVGREKAGGKSDRRRDYDAARAAERAFLAWQAAPDRHRREDLFALWRLAQDGAPKDEVERNPLLGRGVDPQAQHEGGVNARRLRDLWAAEPWRLFVPVECPAAMGERIGRTLMAVAASADFGTFADTYALTRDMGSLARFALLQPCEEIEGNQSVCPEG